MLGTRGLPGQPGIPAPREQLDLRVIQEKVTQEQVDPRGLRVIRVQEDLQDRKGKAAPLVLPEK